MGVTLASCLLERMAADILELPTISRGNTYVLVAEDYCTKFVNLYVLPNQTAHAVAPCLFKCVSAWGARGPTH